MTGRALAGLVRQNLRRGRRAFLLSVFGIGVGISSLAFFLALSSGVRRVVDKVFPVGQVEVVPASSTLDTSPLSILSSLSGPRALTDEVAQTIAQRKDVKAVYRRMRLAFPARASGGQAILGREIHAELIAEGLDPAAAAGEPTAPVPFGEPPSSGTPCASDAECVQPEYCAQPLGPNDKPHCERPVPAVLSPFLLEIYNGAIAPSHHLPRMGGFLASRFRGFVFSAELGTSLIGLTRAGQVPAQMRRIQLVGIAKRAARLAVTLPLDVVRRWNEAYAGPGAAKELSSLTVELKEGADTARFASDIRQLGFALADSGAERIGLALIMLTLLFALVSIAIVGLASVNLAHGFYRAVAERRREIAVLRAIGASAGDVTRIFLAEAAAIGLVGGLCGVACARLGALAVDAAAARMLPDFPFKPDTWFAFGPQILLGALGCAVIACMVGALFPARAAARLEPVEALAAV